MVELDGIEYKVQTAQENAQEMVAYINKYCTDNNITNVQGDIIFIEANRANPLYMMLYGLGYLVSILQKLIYNVGCAFNIAASSPRQLLNLADLANVRRRGASATSIPCLIYAKSDEDCNISTTMTATVSLTDARIAFHPAYSVTVPAGQVINMPLIAEEAGSYTITGGTITEFDTPVTGLDHITTLDSVPGNEQESIASLRARMQNRIQNMTQLERASDAIRQLDGVTSCSIFFNYSNDNAYSVDEIQVPPRRALCVVQGYSDEIARTYYSYLLCESTQGPLDRTTTQNYETAAGQIIPVYIVAPRTVPLFVRIFASGNIQDEIRMQMKEAVTLIAANLEIAQSVSSVQVIEKLRENVPSVNIQGAQLSIDRTTWNYVCRPKADQLYVFSLDNISIEEVDE